MEPIKVNIFVVSHLRELLQQVPSGVGLAPVLLDSLSIPDDFKGNKLAENRLFFSDIFSNSDSEVTGTISARWNERFPQEPPIEMLGALMSKLPRATFYAPLTKRVHSVGELERWITLQDMDHPGMGRLLGKVIAEELPKLSNFTGGSVVLGGQVIANRETLLALKEFVVKWVVKFHEEYGDFPPFKYACEICGVSFDDRVGRWGKERHLGFLAERIVALYFTVKSNEAPLTIQKSSEGYELRVGNLASAAPIFSPWKTSLYRIKNRVMKKCQH